MTEDEMFDHWIETGDYPDGIKSCTLNIEVKEQDGILWDTTFWTCCGHTDFTHINSKRVRKAARIATQAFYSALFDNLENIV